MALKFFLLYSIINHTIMINIVIFFGLHIYSKCFLSIQKIIILYISNMCLYIFLLVLNIFSLFFGPCVLGRLTSFFVSVPYYVQIYNGCCKKFCDELLWIVDFCNFSQFWEKEISFLLKPIIVSQYTMKKMPKVLMKQGV